jgi:rod shape-determining protein MreD
MGDTRRRRLEVVIAHELALAAGMLLIALLQVGLPPQPLDLVPNVMLLTVVCQALLRGSSSASRWAFYGGLALDLCGGSALGVHALGLLMAALAARAALAPLNRTSWIVPLIGVPLGVAAYHLVVAVMTTLTVAPVDPQQYLILTALPELLATLIPTLPFFILMRWIVERQRGGVAIDIY